MGRLPLKFAGKTITYRAPYTMHGELIVANGTNGNLFPDATFLHNVDKPFEVHRMVVRITPFDNTATPVILPPPFIGAVPDLQKILEEYVRLRVLDTSKNETLTKTATLVAGLQRMNTRTWEWEDSYTIVRSEQFQVQVDSILADFTITVEIGRAHV